jgi:hypothetical protein
LQLVAVRLIVCLSLLANLKCDNASSAARATQRNVCGLAVPAAYALDIPFC